MHERPGTDVHRPRGHLFSTLLVVLAAICVVSVFGSGSHFGSENRWLAPKPASTRLAEALAELDLGPELSEETLQRTVRAVLDRATEGDVEAAAFVFELAALQKAEQEPSEDATPEPGDRLTRLFGEQ